MEGRADGYLNADQLAPVGQLPGSAQDSGVEDGCDDHDSNGSSSTTSRGGAMSGFRLNSSDRDGVTGGEESNLSYGDPPSHPILAQEEHNAQPSNHLRENGSHSLAGDEMDQEASEEHMSPSVEVDASGMLRNSINTVPHTLPPASNLVSSSNTFPAPQMRNLSTEGPSSTSGLYAIPSTSSVSANILQGPPPSVTEDGYLGDCSSDGGNEKNFPIPDHRLKRFLGGSHKNCKCHPHSEDIHSDGSIDGSNSFSAASGSIDPPAGLAFQNVQASDLFNSCGYHVLINGSAMNSDIKDLNSTSSPGMHKSYNQYHSNSGGSSRKMRSTLKSKLFHHSNSSWSSLKAGIAERKLRLAAGTNNNEQIERLLSNGINPNAADEHKRTALHITAAKGYAKCVDILLQAGANPNIKDLLGNTPLHLAACTNHIEVVTLLLRAGTNVAELDNNGRTPVQLAQSKLKLLQRNHTNPCSRNENSNNEASEMGKVKTEVAQVVEMMREYLSKTGHGANSAYSELLNSFSNRFKLHQTQDDLNTDLQSLLDSLGSLKLSTQPPSELNTDQQNLLRGSNSTVSDNSGVPTAATATSNL